MPAPEARADGCPNQRSVSGFVRRRHEAMTAGVEAPGSGVLSADLEATPALEGVVMMAPKAVAAKIAALAAAAHLDAQPVPGVSYHSRGNLLIVAGGELARATRAAHSLAADLSVTLLATDVEPAPAPFARW